VRARELAGRRGGENKEAREGRQGKKRKKTNKSKPASRGGGHGARGENIEGSVYMAQPPWQPPSPNPKGDAGSGSE